MKQPNTKRTLYRGLRRLLPLLLLVCMPFQTAVPVTGTTAEYKLKAALIYKLTKFVEWPAAASEAQPRNFGICLLGRDDFGSALEALTERNVKGREIDLRRYNQSEGIDESCQVLFISDSKQPFMQGILDGFGKQPILTISDAEGFAAKGGIIQFVSGEKRIGFKINLERATAAGLKIAAPLLDLATIVDSQNKGNGR